MSIHRICCRHFSFLLQQLSLMNMELPPVIQVTVISMPDDFFSPPLLWKDIPAAVHFLHHATQPTSHTSRLGLKCQPGPDTLSKHPGCFPDILKQNHLHYLLRKILQHQWGDTHSFSLQLNIVDLHQQHLCDGSPQGTLQGAVLMSRSHGDLREWLTFSSSMWTTLKL